MKTEEKSPISAERI
jgi:hypothetical protein